MRGPFRSDTSTRDEAPPLSILGFGIRGRQVRPATADERQDAVATAVLLVLLSLILIVVGVAADESAELF